MKKKSEDLGRLKERNPFLVPEGYMEGLTQRIMSRLPEKNSFVEPEKVSLFARVRPWLYMAAAFAGLVLLFNVLIEKKGTGDATRNESLLVQAQPTPAVQAIDDEEYLEYLETEYVGYILEEEMAVYE